MSRSRWLGILLLGLAVIAASTAVWAGIQQQPMSVPSVSSSPSLEPSPSVTIPSTPPQPSSTPTKVSSKNPRGEPVSLTIKRGKKTIVETMPFAPRRIYAGKDVNKFGSQCGAVAYWDRPKWPKPGVASLNKSLITGHVMCGSNNWYPFQHLQPITKNGKKIAGGRKGDLLYIQYGSGDVVVATAREDSHEVVKTKLNQQQKYTENGGEKAREIRVTTCDRTGVIRPDGHALKNVVQRFSVIAVHRAAKK